jgi:hypothetical protein
MLDIRKSPILFVIKESAKTSEGLYSPLLYSYNDHGAPVEEIISVYDEIIIAVKVHDSALSSLFELFEALEKNNLLRFA